MSAWKQFTTKDVTITPFIADKGFTFTGTELTGSTVGINIVQGRNVNYTSSLNLVTGVSGRISQSSAYNSAKQLYYTNYLTSSTGDNAVTSSVVPGATSEFDRFVGPIQAPLYDNYLQSTLEQKRFFNPRPGAQITTISIPQKVFGDKIVPYTFEFTYTASGISGVDSVFLTDDGDGNVISGSDNEVVGQIFYSHGIAVLTTHSMEFIGKDLYFGGGSIDNVTVAYSSSITIYEQQYKCTILENEFGVSTNPSLLTGSANTVEDNYDRRNTRYYPFATGSFFTPYVTCVGLYNEAKQLVAVGKLSFPLPISQFTDTSILVNFDI